MKKRFLSFMLVAAMLLSFMPVMAFADDLPEGAAWIDGTGTTPVWYKLEDSNTKLTIDGSGAMPDFAGYDNQPWKDNRDKIQSVVIESGVTNIGDNAFAKCSSLSSIIIPNSVTNIGQRAFDRSGLINVVIPESVTNIGAEVFNNCASLTSIQVDNANTTFESVDGVLFSKDQSTLICYPPAKTGTEYTIPSTVTSIGERAFQSCSNLTKIEIPSTVTSIGARAFQECKKLTSVEIPESVSSINAYTFWKCTSLASVKIPSSVTNIASNAFKECSNLVSVISLAAVPPTLNAYAFDGCAALALIKVPADSVDAYKAASGWSAHAGNIEKRSDPIKWNYFGDGDFLRPYSEYSCDLTSPQPLINKGLWIDEEMGEFWYKYEKAAGLTYEPEGAVWLTFCDWTTDSAVKSTLPGIYKVSWYIKPDSNHVYTEYNGQQVTKDNPAYDYTLLDAGEVPQVTSPVLYSDLQYTGKAQELCTAGSIDFDRLVDDGSYLEYAVGTDNVNAPETEWSATVPSRTDAGKYYVWHRWIVSNAAFVGYAPECLGCVEITGSIPAPIYYGGGDDTTTVTVPVSGDEKSVNVSVTVSGSTATVKRISDADLEKVTEGESVAIDLSSVGKNVDTAKIPTETVEKIAEKSSLTVKFPVATVEFDKTATEEIADQAEGSNIELVVDDIKEVSLNAVQKESVKKLDTAVIIDAHLASNGSKLCTAEDGGFGGGKAKVILPYEIKNNRKPENYSVFYVNEAGKLEKLNAVYDTQLVAFVFEIEHFSVYAVAFEQFIDIDANAYYYDAVKWAVANGVTDGVDATHFNPSGITDRAQMVTFLWKAAGKPEPTITETPFTDLDPDWYYYKAVLWAYENGITDGTSVTTFEPNKNVSRAQVVTFLWRYAGKPYVDYFMNMSDVASGKYYTEAVRWALAEKITEGTTTTTFSPNDDCLRGQIVTFLYRDFAK